MLIHFWGVRGSLPVPQLPGQIKSKISAVLERLTPEDIVSPETRERFLAGLPPWLFGTVGGNSSCVAVRPEGREDLFVFDAGSGIRELGISVGTENPKPRQYRVFFSHFHWDHLQGLPFFGPAYDPSVAVDFYSPKPDLEAFLRGQMTSPYFPVHMESMGSKKTFHTLTGPAEISGMVVSYKKMNHPGDSYSYKVYDGVHNFIYATDTELSASDFVKNEENTAYFAGADLIVIDSQYTLGEAIEKYNWGHSAFSLAVDFAANWGIKHMVLFHHDPTYDDRKLFNMLQSARWYTERMNIKGIKLTLAIEGMEIKL
ncbi:MAG: MBL fold metallo-hydrolase [Treponema sp.]|jgi:phosphoribosyl 1,2-cyclic phosphodiesterase|nr:MBL fold metallo-hydrolase [Treponema sp.]